MKKLLLITMLIASASVFAADPTNTQGTANSTSTSETASAATNSGQGNGNTVSFTSPADLNQTVNYSGSYTLRNVPSVSGPPLTTSNDTCMGSMSGSVNIAGLGLGGGSTYVDENCKRLKNSRELWNMGMRAASMALMCNDAENQEALRLTGYSCPQVVRTNVQSSNVPATPNALPAPSMQYTDPIVRARLGLPPVR